MYKEELPKLGDYYYSFKHDPKQGINHMAYEIMGTGEHTETLEKLVTYKPLYECKYSKEHNLDFWSRPIKMFMEEIEVPDYKGPRFTKIEDKELIKKINLTNQD